MQKETDKQYFNIALYKEDHYYPRLIPFDDHNPSQLKSIAVRIVASQKQGEIETSDRTIDSDPFPLI